MSMEKWIELNTEEIELAEVTELEKRRIKQHLGVTTKPKRSWRPLLGSGVAAAGLLMVLGFSFPTVAAQIPFMSQVMSYFQDTDTEGYERYSSEIGMSQSSGDIEVLVDQAVFDGTSVTIAFAVDAKEKEISLVTLQETSVKDANGLSGSTELIPLGDGTYAGLAIVTPDFKGETSPRDVQLTWNPLLYTPDGENVEGDWSFDLSLARIDGDIQLMNQVVQNADIRFTLTSMEQTPVSTIIAYEQLTEPEFLAEWGFISPMFRAYDDLGNVYLDEESGSGVASKEGTVFKGTSSFGAIDEEATTLTIVPLIMASQGSGAGHEVIELEPLTIELNE